MLISCAFTIELKVKDSDKDPQAHLLYKVYNIHVLRSLTDKKHLLL